MLNLDAGAGGVAYIELLSSAGEVLPGFSRAEAIATATNSLEAVVRWRSPVNNKTLDNVASLLGKPIRISFELEDAVLRRRWGGVARIFAHRHSRGAPPLHGVLLRWFR